MLLKEGADPEVIFSSSCTYTEPALINLGYVVTFEDKKCHLNISNLFYTINFKVETSEGHTALLRAVKSRLLPMVFSNKTPIYSK